MSRAKELKTYSLMVLYTMISTIYPCIHFDCVILPHIIKLRSGGKCHFAKPIESNPEKCYSIIR